MCGIYAIYSAKKPISRTTVRRMNIDLRHRGPDDEGYYLYDFTEKISHRLHGGDSTVRTGIPADSMPEIANALLLGHRRLSILDLSSSARQPMGYDDDNYLIVYNGEVFNYVELRNELSERGHAFGTSSDTEVILAAYKEWGEDCASRFNGDWAFALFDRKRRKLFLSRDRFGIKPLYYFFDASSGTFAVSSEIKTFESLPDRESEIDYEKCFEFLAFGLLDHDRRTMYKDVFQVEPGCNLVFDFDDLSISHEKYYMLDYADSLGTYDEGKALSYAADIRDLLIDSVRLRLRSDVPIGTCLSGGLDSSSIVMIINELLKKEGVSAKQIGERQKTFTASFPGDAVDESGYSGLVNSLTDADGHPVYPTPDGMAHEILNIVRHQEQPFTSASIYAQWKVMEEAGRHVKVVLDGQGGDEVFGGYAIYRNVLFAQMMCGSGLGSLFRELVEGGRTSGSIGRFLAETGALPLYLLPEGWKRFLYLASKRGRIRAASKYLGLESGNGHPPAGYVSSSFLPNLNGVMHSSQTRYSLPALLRYEDRNSMAFSVESRTPFTDHRLVDYVFAIPAIYKYRNGWSKWLLRLAMKGLLPDEILWRRDKIGFAVSSRFDNYDRKRIFEAWHGHAAGDSRIPR